MKISDLMYSSAIYEHLGEVGSYAYSQNCPGLTISECAELEELCDKAREGIEEDNRKSLEFFVKGLIKEREEKK